MRRRLPPSAPPRKDRPLELEAWAGRLRATLGAVLCPEDFDVVLGSERDALEVVTDDWTLRIEQQPNVVAWLAIDDEPDDPDARQDARRALMPIAVERALAALDRRSDGALGGALRASGDPLSLDLADALVTHQGTTMSS